MERLAIDCKERELKECRALEKSMISRSSKSLGKPRNLHNHLYYQAFQAQDKLEKSRNLEIIKSRKLSSGHKPLKSSILMFEDLLEKRVSQLFEKMDSDRDGLISAMRIDVSEIEPTTLKIIAPLLIEMEEISVVLDFESFYNAISRLLKEVSVNERNHVLGLSGKRKACTGSMEECSFAPEINPLSRYIVEKMKKEGRSQASKSLIGVGLDDKNLEECTFQPKINNYAIEESAYCKNN